jgi:hypothetical protein
MIIILLSYLCFSLCQKNSISCLSKNDLEPLNQSIESFTNSYIMNNKLPKESFFKFDKIPKKYNSVKLSEKILPKKSLDSKKIATNAYFE